MLDFIKRVLAAVIWCFFAFATTLSFLSNPDPKWYDYASATPLFIISIALALGNNWLLIDDLNGWLKKLGGRDTDTNVNIRNK